MATPEKVFDGGKGHAATRFSSVAEASEFLLQENAYPPRTHDRKQSEGGEVERVPCHFVGSWEAAVHSPSTEGAGAPMTARDGIDIDTPCRLHFYSL